MVVFTGPDKALLDRAARLIDAQAKALKWDSIVDPKKRKAAKLEFDRLNRDAFDLRALAQRLKQAAKVIKVALQDAQVHQDVATLSRTLTATDVLVDTAAGLARMGQNDPVTP